MSPISFRNFAAASAFAFGAFAAGSAQAETNAALKPGVNRVTFKSEGQTMKGNLYLPENYRPGDKLPVAIVTGSWTTVKEQMAGTYAQKLAGQGIAALTFDFRNFGESGGEPRQYESPVLKTRDIQNAVSYLQTVNVVDANRIGGLAICASAGYMADAVAQDSRIKSYVAVAPWIHDAALVAQMYGGKEGVTERLQDAAHARSEYNRTHAVAYVPAISTSDKKAAMFGDFDYYLNPQRGAIPQWKNQFAVQSWADWLGYSAMPSAPKIHVPTLFVHSEQAAIPEGAKAFYNRLGTTDKRFIWMDGTQFDFYDNPKQVNAAAAAAVDHFGRTL
jgi:fermentation-respiration switch protein FrsA (DUF1100 family)